MPHLYQVSGRHLYQVPGRHRNLPLLMTRPNPIRLSFSRYQPPLLRNKNNTRTCAAACKTTQRQRSISTNSSKTFHFFGKTHVKDIADILSANNLSTHTSKIYYDHIKEPRGNIPEVDRPEDPTNLDMLARFIFHIPGTRVPTRWTRLLQLPREMDPKATGPKLDRYRDLQVKVGYY